MDGWHFIDRLKKDPAFRSIPIFLVTAYSEKTKSLENKVNGILKKPLDLISLYKVVDRHC